MTSEFALALGVIESKTVLMSENQLDALARERSQAMPASFAQWRAVTEQLFAISEVHTSDLLFALPNARTGWGLLKLLSRELNPESALQEFIKSVDASEEPLSAWLAALEILLTHIDKTSHRPTLQQAAGYLHCSVSLVGTGTRYASFADTVRIMLETYGYEGR